MSIPKDVVSYLDKHGVKYEIVPHKKVFTAYDLAQTLGEDLAKVAKTLLLAVELPEIKKGKKFFIVAVPASYKVELEKIRKTLKAKSVEFAPEKVMKKLGIEPGSLSPFAAMHTLELLMDNTLLKTKQILVRAGSLTESIRMKTKDLHAMEKSLAGVFGKKSNIKLQKHTVKAKKKVTSKKKSVIKKNSSVKKTKKVIRKK